MKKLTKIIANTLLIASIFALNPIGANAEWENSFGRYKYKEGNSYLTGWQYIDNDWYCFDSNGEIRIGWVYFNGNWYFYYTHGQMAHDTVINGYYLNSNGAWTNEISADGARKLVLNQDEAWLKKKLDRNETIAHNELSTIITRINADDAPFAYEYWNISKEDFYKLSINYYGIDGKYKYTPYNYFVGIYSKKVYIVCNKDNMDVYELSYGRKINTFKAKNENSSSWHGESEY